MNRWVVVLLVLLMAGCSGLAKNDPGAAAQVDPQEEIQKTKAQLNDYGPAPELTSLVWLNTDQPLSLAGLRGKVVLLDMWTFG
jgi:hypothetical protein